MSNPGAGSLGKSTGRGALSQKARAGVPEPLEVLREYDGKDEWTATPEVPQRVHHLPGAWWATLEPEASEKARVAEPCPKKARAGVPKPLVVLRGCGPRTKKSIL